MKHTLASSIFAAVFGLSVGSFFVGIASAQTAPVKLRFGHAHPVTDSQHVAALEFAKKVKERTQGGIEIQVFPSNQLGNDNTMIAGVRGGVPCASAMRYCSALNLPSRWNAGMAAM